MTRRLLGLALVTLGLSASADELLIWHPGAGSAEEATSVLGEFARYLANHMGLPESGVSISYASSEQEGLDYTAAKPPKIAIVSLPVYLKYRDEYKWTAVLEAKRPGTTGRFVTVVHQSQGFDLPPLAEIKNTELPAGLTLFGTEATWDPAFGAMVAGGPATFETSGIAAAWRKVGAAEGTGLVMTDAEYETMRAQPDKRKEKHKAVHVSDALPINLVVVQPDVDASALIEAIHALVADPAAADLRKTLRLESLVDADHKALEAIEAAYE